MDKLPHIKQQHGIFLSSTNDPEVRNYRLAARSVIEEEEFRDKWYAVEMDTFTPSGSSSLDECRDLVLSCSVYIGILGPFYGSVISETKLSYTEYEYTVARDADREIAIFLLPDDIISTSLPEIVKKQGPNMPRQDEFKERVNARHMNRPVSTIDDFKGHLRRYIRSLNDLGIADPHFVKISDDFPGVDTFDRKPVPSIYSIKDLNAQAISDFLKTPQALMALDRQNMLEASTDHHLRLLGLLHQTNNPTLGLFLCFAPPNLVADKFSACSLHMVVYSSTKRGTSRTEYKEEAEDNLINLYRIGMKFFRTNAGLKRIGNVGTEDRDELEIPSIALREALANALVHRDYEQAHSKEQPTRIEVYSDRVEIISFGGFVPGISESILNSDAENIISLRRNPIIAKIFMYMQIVEMGGSGVSRMRNAMQKLNLPLPEIRQIGGDVHSVRVIFQRPSREAIPVQPQQRSVSSVFISYARQDGTEYAEKLERDLNARGFTTWRDVRGIEAYQDFSVEIEKAIVAASHVVVCITPSVSENPDSFVRREVLYAQTKSKPIIPLLFPNATLPIMVNHLTYIPFTQQSDDAQTLGYDTGFQALINRLNYFSPTSKMEKDPFHNYLTNLYEQVVSYLDQTVFSLVSLEVAGAPDAVIFDKSSRALPMTFFAGAGLEESTRYTSFSEAFDQYDGRLLLLGEPGSGKTTALMTFARDAIAKRLEDPTQPLPFIAPISTWDSDTKPSMVEWLASSIQALDRKELTQVFEDGSALLLLDGLEELGHERISQNTSESYDPRLQFLRVIPSNNQVVVTSRIKDYAEIGEKINLNGAITLQPLNDEQIALYLRETPDLAVALQSDDQLREIARTPLLLSLLTYAFTGLEIEVADLRQSPADLRDKIFEIYIKRRYEHESRKPGEIIPFSLAEMYLLLGKLALYSVIHKVENFSVSEVGRITGLKEVQAFVEFSSKLNITTQRDQDTYSFSHRLMRDHLAFSHAQEQLASSDTLERDLAIQTLGRIRDSRSVALLINALHDKNKRIAETASNALRQIATPEALDALDAWESSG